MIKVISNIVLLLACIQHPIEYPYSDISAEDEIFMYVKNYCPYSKFASKFLTQHVHKVTIVDTINKEFVLFNAYDKFKGTAGNATDLIEIFPHKSVPQIFVYRDNKWYSVGGSNDLFKLHITTKEDDMVV